MEVIFLPQSSVSTKVAEEPLFGCQNQAVPPALILISYDIVLQVAHLLALLEAGSLALAAEEFQGGFMLQDPLHAFVGQAAPEGAQELAGFGEDVDPGEGQEESGELVRCGGGCFLSDIGWE